MTVELTRVEHIQIKLIKMFRKTIRSFLNMQDLQSGFRMTYSISTPVSELPEALKSFGIRTDVFNHWGVFDYPYPRRSDVYRALLQNLHNLDLSDMYTIDFLVTELVDIWKNMDIVELDQIVVRHIELKTTFMRYHPAEYLNTLRHLEGDNQGQNIHLLNALKYQIKE